jgi:hypothetical protein
MHHFQSGEGLRYASTTHVDEQFKSPRETQNQATEMGLLRCSFEFLERIRWFFVDPLFHDRPSHLNGVETIQVKPNSGI